MASARYSSRISSQTASTVLARPCARKADGGPAGLFERLSVALRTVGALSRRTPLYRLVVRGEGKRVAPARSSPPTKGGYRGVNSHRPRGVCNALVARSQQVRRMILTIHDHRSSRAG